MFNLFFRDKCVKDGPTVVQFRGASQEAEEESMVVAGRKREPRSRPREMNCRERRNWADKKSIWRCSLGGCSCRADEQHAGRA